MAAYLVYNQLDVTDAAAMEDYRSKVRPMLDSYGARIIASDANADILEGRWTGIRDVIIEFPDMDTLRRWYTSDEYKPLRETRLGAARGNLVAVKGI